MKKKRFNQFDLNLRYCPENEVHAKERSFLRLKYALGLRLRHLIIIGKGNMVNSMLETWVD